MTDEKWQKLIENAQQNFEDVTVYSEDLFAESGDDMVKQGNADVLEFNNAQGRFKIVRENKPVLLDKKMHFSHRAGDGARTEYVFSDNEFSHKIVAYKEDNTGEWQKLDASKLGL